MKINLSFLALLFLAPFLGGCGFSESEEPAPEPSSPASALKIEEFRVRGLMGANDEFIKIYNNSSLHHTVAAASGTDTLYKEGTGVPALTAFSVDYAWVRDICGKGGSITTFGACPSSTPIDTGNNAADFFFVDTNGTSAGAPGPQNLASPVFGTLPIAAAALTSCSADTAAPNLVRDFTSDAGNNATFGTLDIRPTFTNNTGAPITRLRFRIIDPSTFPAPTGFADLRPRTSAGVVVVVDRPPCGVGTSNITVVATTLEQPPSQPNGSGFNGSLSAGTVTPETPLANGASIDLRFLLGIQQTGNFKLGIVVESLPKGGAIFQISGATG